jgi:hypothetical protein
VASKSSFLTITGPAIAGFLACIGDFIVTFILGALYPHYNLLHQSESYLGTANSPVAIYMNAWGVVFCVLLIIFAWGLRKSIFNKGKWQKIVVWSIALYGIGEGAGSGLFPYDHVGNVLTLSGELHSLFGVLGGISIALIPFACSKIFSKVTFPTMHAYSWFVFSSGLLFIILFMISRHDLIPYKGLWQRIFILDYHLFLCAIAGLMMKKQTLYKIDNSKIQSI